MKCMTPLNPSKSLQLQRNNPKLNMNPQKPTSLVGRVPFSWENQPGISKVTPHLDQEDPIKLPPPPISSATPKPPSHGLYLPLPPCAFQSSSTRDCGGWRDKEDDPFLAALVECTKSGKRGGKKTTTKGRKRDGWISLSCKSSCGVRENNLVRMPSSKIPEFDSRE